jgi:signal transduction histidine kinase
LSTRSWLARLDRILIGGRSLGNTDRIRVRLMATAAVFTIPFWVVFGVAWSVGGSSLALWINSGAALAVLSTIPAVRAGLSPTVAGRLYVSIVFVAILLFVALVHGFEPTILAWQLIIPVAAVIFRNRRAAAVWAVLFVVEVVVLAAVDAQGALPQPAQPTGVGLRTMQAGNLIGILLLLLLVAGIHESAQRDADTERERWRESMQRSERLANLGSLAASIGHEINNPIAYVISSLEHLRGSVEITGSSVREALNDAIDGAERVGRIAAQLNAFARVSSEPRPFRVAEVVHAALALAANELRHLGRIERVGEEDVWVRASDELSQVVLNLLVNAVHAIRSSEAEPGTGCVRIRVTRSERRVYLDVEDNGPGIPPEVREAVFEPFFTTKDVGEGTGLGLAISQEMMEKLDGAIEVHPLEPHGTRFRLVLPMAEAPEHSSMRPLPPSSDAALRVLVVDDEPALLRAFKRMLRDHEVTTAPSGTRALELLEAGEFDLVLCDVMMPGMSGTELHRRVPESVARLFVFITGGAFDDAEAEYLERSGQPTLAKPVDPDALLAIMDARRAASVGSSIA